MPSFRHYWGTLLFSFDCLISLICMLYLWVILFVWSWSFGFPMYITHILIFCFLLIITTSYCILLLLFLSIHNLLLAQPSSTLAWIVGLNGVIRWITMEVIRLKTPTIHATIVERRWKMKKSQWQQLPPEMVVWLVKELLTNWLKKIPDSKQSLSCRFFCYPNISWRISLSQFSGV